MSHKRGTKKVPRERCEVVLYAHAMGHCVKNIASYFKMPLLTVSNILLRMRKRRNGTLALRQGQPFKLNGAELRRLESVLL